MFTDLQSVEVPHLNAEILKLPYFGERAHMLIILPDENADLTQVSLNFLLCNFVPSLVKMRVIGSLTFD